MEGEKEPRGYLQRDLPCTTSQARLLDEVCEMQAKRDLVVHLLMMLLYFGQEWTAIYCRLMTHPDKGLTNCPERTADVWEDLVVLGVLRVREYDRRNRKSREFALTANFVQRWSSAGQGEKRGTKKAINGKRDRAQPKKTQLYDEKRNYWRDRSPYEPLGQALSALSEANHTLDLDAHEEIERLYREAEARRKEERDEAHERAVEVADEVEARGLTPRDPEWKESVGRAQHEARTADQEWRSALERAVSYGACHDRIKKQELEELDSGLTRIQNAYKVQEISGRLSFIGGGPQNQPRVAKALYYGTQEGVHNYDVANCHTVEMRHAAEDLRQVGAEVDTAPLDEYLRAGGKDWASEEYDLPRKLVKRVEHAVKQLGAIPASVADAEGRDRCDVWELVKEYCRGEEAEALEKLHSIFDGIARMSEEVASGLVGAYWEANRVPGGQGKGYVMRNACGVTFCPFDYKPGHRRRSKAMAWYLQGMESAFVHALASLQGDYGYTVVANEHDGLITRGEIPAAAVERARELSGFTRAELAEKPFADAGDFNKAFGKGNWRKPLAEYLPDYLKHDEEPCQNEIPGASGSDRAAAGKPSGSPDSTQTERRSGPKKKQDSLPASEGRSSCAKRVSRSTPWTPREASTSRRGDPTGCATKKASGSLTAGHSARYTGEKLPTGAMVRVISVRGAASIVEQQGERFSVQTTDLVRQDE